MRPRHPPIYVDDEGRRYYSTRFAADTIGVTQQAAAQWAEARKVYGRRLDVIQHGRPPKPACGGRDRTPLYIAERDIMAIRAIREERSRPVPQSEPQLSLT